MMQISPEQFEIILPLVVEMGKDHGKRESYGIDSNFKASAPNPPRNYSCALGSGADVNEHFRMETS